MGKNQSASNLTNIIKQDASGNITFVSGSTTLMSVSSSGAVTTTGNVAGTASYATNADLLDGAHLSILATTGSNTFTGVQTVNSNLIVTGSITAQTLVVQTITSSVDFVTGSTRFGSLLGNTHVFSGSVTMNPGGLFVSSSGNVGIGTTTPRISASGTNRTLDIKGGIYFGDTNSESCTINNNDSMVFNIDADNSSTSNFFRFATNTTQETGGTELMRITETGSVGIGTSNPTNSVVQIKGVNNDVSGYVDGLKVTSNNETVYVNYNWTGINANDTLRIATTGTERMRIASNGKVGIGTTNPQFDVTIGTNANQKVIAVGAIHLIDAYIDNAVYGCRIQGTDNGIDGTNMQFVMRNTPSGGFSTKMTITTGGNIGAPSGTNIYNASDRRLKRNIIPLSNALNKILNLNPVMFNWIQGYEPTEEDKDMLGFIAQDVQNVVPEAVESFAGGDTLKVGNLEITNPLRVNEKFIIPVLVKAIQELKAENDTLKERLTAGGL